MPKRVQNTFSRNRYSYKMRLIFFFFRSKNSFNEQGHLWEHFLLKMVIKFLQFLTWSLWLTRRISWAGAGSSPSLVGILCCAGDPQVRSHQHHPAALRGWPRAVTTWKCSWWSQCLLCTCLLNYWYQRSCSFRKHQNVAFLLLQSSLRQFPSFFSITMEALHPVSELLELLGEAHSSSFAPQQLQCLCCNHQISGFKLRYFWGGFTESAVCYAKWPRCLWCNNFSRLFSQTFCKITEISIDLQQHKQFSSVLSYLPSAGWHEQHAND